MIFGGGKKALGKEIQSSVEGILLQLDKMAEDTGATAESPKAELSPSVSTLQDATQIMSQRLSDLVNDHGRIASEYEEFVRSCESTDDLSQGIRYQLASDFFSYVVAENDRNRKAIEALAQDFATLTEELAELAAKVRDSSGDSAEASRTALVKEHTEKLKESVRGLAEQLSIDLKPPAQQEGK
ncbi:MAG: hypothetical protein JW759_01680 [Candidatus Coatesbacteria bacterium]|nr:hypothetical protein [Candidatus Coatesbacteria bacterium]